LAATSAGCAKMKFVSADLTRVIGGAYREQDRGARCSRGLTPDGDRCAGPSEHHVARGHRSCAAVYVDIQTLDHPQGNDA
jgi:hypothetical protein